MNVIEQLLEIEDNESTNLVWNNEFGEFGYDSSIDCVVTKHIAIYNDMTEERIQFYNSFGLTKEEAFILNIFTGFGSQYINQELASPCPKINEHQSLIIEIFDRTLNKIDKGDTEYVYRMDSLAIGNEKRVFNFYKYNSNKVIQIPWFLSTTEDSESWLPKVIWQIKILPPELTCARKVHPLVVNHGEEYEVRFERNVKFKVVGTGKRNDNYIIQLEEISSKTYDINLSYTIYYSLIKCNCHYLQRASVEFSKKRKTSEITILKRLRG